MTRGVAVDREELFEAADRLQAQGKQVTALALLEELGRGSLTTIYRHLEVWKKRKVKQAATEGEQEIPASVQSAFWHMWRVALEQASKHDFAAVVVRELCKTELAGEQAISEKLRQRVNAQEEEIRQLREQNKKNQEATDRAVLALVEVQEKAFKWSNLNEELKAKLDSMT
jgi:hypothetical protein